WADRRSEDNAESINREGNSAFFDRDRIGNDRLLGRCKSSSAQSLDDPEEYQHPEIGRYAAHERTPDKQHDACHVETLASEECGEPSADRKDDSVRDEVGGKDPGC